MFYSHLFVIVSFHIFNVVDDVENPLKTLSSTIEYLIWEFMRPLFTGKIFSLKYLDHLLFKEDFFVILIHCGMFRRDANESLELAIAKQLQKDIKIPHQPSVPPKHYPNRGTLNHYSHPSFKAPTETPKPSEPTSETSSAAIANRKRSHSSFPFLLITHITAVPSSNNPSLQRLGSSGLSVRSSSLEGRRRPPAPDHHSENIENSG